VKNKFCKKLEELYKGSMRKMKVSRNLVTLAVEEILSTKVKVG
jgi:hypothetical protein